MSKIIVIGSQKGGVGKTTTTFNLSYALSRMGKKVLAVDFDSQANLTTCYGVENKDELDEQEYRNFCQDMKKASNVVYITDNCGEIVLDKIAIQILKKTFPNIQFILTTHSPIVLNEIDDSYNLFFMHSQENDTEAIAYNRMDGFDANYILEEFMGTKSKNEETEKLVSSIYANINSKKYEKAEQLIEQLVELTNENNPDVIMARLSIKRGRLS